MRVWSLLLHFPRPKVSSLSSLSPASRRRLAAILALGLGVTTLAACSTGGGVDRSGSDCMTSGAGSDSIKVEGDPGAEPEVEFESPLKVKSTERTVVVEGEGSDVAEKGDTVTIAYMMFNGGTGEELVSSGYSDDTPELPFLLDESRYQPGVDLAVMKSLNCSVEGDRIVAAISPDDAFGGDGNEEMGFDATDPLIFVVDVLSVDEPVDAARDMVDVEPDAEGMPTVEYGADGAPAVTFPESKPLDELTRAVITEGDGDVVAEGDMVEVHYTGVNWDSGEVFDSSWSRGKPETFPTTGVIPGFGAALVGKPVGSQVVVVIPPDYGYGDAGKGSIGGSDTIVFTVDILGVVAD